MQSIQTAKAGMEVESVFVTKIKKAGWLQITGVNESLVIKTCYLLERPATCYRCEEQHAGTMHLTHAWVVWEGDSSASVYPSSCCMRALIVSSNCQVMQENLPA